MKLGIYLETFYSRFNSSEIGCADTYTNLFNKFPQDLFELHILGRVEPINDRYFYPFSLPVTLHEISYYPSLSYLFSRYPLYIWKNHKSIDLFVAHCDRFLVMTPSPIASYILKRAEQLGKPCFLLVRQNTNITIPYRFNGIKRIFAISMAKIMERSIEAYANRNQSVVFTLGDETYKRYLKYSSKTLFFVSSRYSKEDVINNHQIRSINWADKIRLLFVGRLEVDKGLGELISAMKDLKKHNVNLTIIGDGAYRDNLKDLIQSYDLHRQVQMIGYIPFGPMLLSEYSKHDILILPSYSEGLPQVIFEAMAKGCLVIATKVGGIPNVIKDNENGYLISPFSSLSISNRIEQLLVSKPDTSTLIKAGKTTAIQFAIENQLHVLIDNLNK